MSRRQPALGASRPDRASTSARRPGVSPAPFGPATDAVRAFIIVANGLTAQQAERIGEAQRRARTMTWLAATGEAWKVARKSRLQFVAEQAHGAAFAAANGDLDVKEAAAFAVLPLVLGPRLKEDAKRLLCGPWAAGVRPASDSPEASPDAEA